MASARPLPPLATAFVLGAACLATAACDSGVPEPVHLATAHQMGPVAYRDPAGAVSPDGRSTRGLNHDRESSKV
ncbi:MAG: hypothetical protein OXH66_03910, partial [Gemmatimonadetes bacterium]|nr:hypothetical protein [Gemmatimonadota bacterium]